MRVPWPAAVRAATFALLVAAAGCGSSSTTAHDGGGGSGGGHADSSSASDLPGDRGSPSAADAHPDGVGTGGPCAGDTDCKQYPDGVGGCCGVCIPATDPQPKAVQCLLPCATPNTSCTCVNRRCVGSTAPR